mmetsp:Transcript_9407/g.17970  ORF Transcript_9407/g.17970 Transcript_9407/m.17970 type:complete len:82 (-) Transcript_9407:33-278(-)
MRIGKRVSYHEETNVTGCRRRKDGCGKEGKARQKDDPESRAGACEWNPRRSHMLISLSSLLAGDGKLMWIGLSSSTRFKRR